MSPITSETSSAPTLPCLARRSDIFVNPETSTNTVEPSISRPSTSGVDRGQSSTSRGT